MIGRKRVGKTDYSFNEYEKNRLLKRGQKMSGKQLEQELRMLQGDLNLLRTLQRLTFQTTQNLSEQRKTKQRILRRACLTWNLLSPEIKDYVNNEIYTVE